jgi:hypothetical protein
MCHATAQGPSMSHFLVISALSVGFDAIYHVRQVLITKEPETYLYMIGRQKSPVEYLVNACGHVLFV